MKMDTRFKAQAQKMKPQFKLPNHGHIKIWCSDMFSFLYTYILKNELFLFPCKNSYYFSWISIYELNCFHVKLFVIVGINEN